MVSCRGAVVLDNYVLPSRTAYASRDRAYPRIVEGSGPYLQDQAGRIYLDAACGSGSLIFGHGDVALAEVLAEQASRLSLFPSKMFGVEIVERYTAALKEFGPAGTSRIFCMSSGSDAVEGALKLAVQYHVECGARERSKFIGRKASYHGNTLAGLAVGGFWQRRAPYESCLWQHAKAEATCGAVCDLQQGCPGAESVESAIEAEGSETVAAVIIEPVVGAARSAVAPCPGYLAEVRAICDRHGVLLILDEVMTGFCRTGPGFASELWAVRPDITICGKAISAGYFPLSAILVAEDVAAALEARRSPFQSGHTHACNPIAAAVGLEVVSRLGDGAVEAASLSLGRRIRDELKAAVPGRALANIRGQGMMLGFDVVVPERAAPARPGAWADLLQECALGAGLIVYPSSGGPEGMGGEHAMLLPPLNLAERHVDELVGKLVKASEAYLERSSRGDSIA